MKAALYARVSTEDQAKEGFSLDAQLDRLRSYCDARGWEAVDEYVDDGYSGRDEARPAYTKMLEERERWDTILVLKMDRIHRNSRNFMEMMDRLRSWEKEFTSMQESLDTGTAMGRFVMDIIQRIAQLESEQIAERVYIGMYQKAKSGQGHLGSPAPLGYRYEGGRLVVDEEKAPFVQEVFRRYLQRNQPLQWISVDLTRKLRGRSWSIWSVRYLLQNPIYAGFLYWDGILTKGDHEPLVSPHEYEQVLLSFIERTHADSSREKLERLLAGVREATEEENGYQQTHEAVADEV